MIMSPRLIRRQADICCPLVIHNDMRLKFNQLRKLIREAMAEGPQQQVSVVPVLTGEENSLVWTVAYGQAYGEVDATTGEIILESNSGDSAVFRAVLGALSEWCTADMREFNLENRDKIVGEIDVDPST